jgi:hypothetical protein
MGINMDETVLRLKPGVYGVKKPMQIGSMRVVGTRNFVVFPALATFYRKVHNLLVGNPFKKDLPATATEIIDISVTFENRPNK